jgi:hypothetical protein
MKAVRLVALLIACLLLFQTPCSASESPIPSQCIVIYGDTRTNHVAHKKVVDAIMKVRPTVVFHTGDLVEDGLNPDHWAVFNKIFSPLMRTVKFYPALGNHENDSQLFFDNFDLPNNERWYSVEVNDIHFIVLDSNSDTRKGSEQYQWLETDLRNVGGKMKFIIAIFHHPPFSTGPHGEDEKGLRKTVVPLFDKMVWIWFSMDIPMPMKDPYTMISITSLPVGEELLFMIKCGQALIARYLSKPAIFAG